jgi:pimeloyl-[acyl-carrier protein] methyl ester esterase
MVAMRLESLLPARVKRLILVSTTPCFVCCDGWQAGQPVARVRALARQYRRHARLALENFFISQFQDENIAPVQVREWAQDMVAGQPLPAARAALETLETLRTDDLRAHLGPAACPALIVHGGRDGIIPPAAGRYLAEQRKNSRFMLMPEAGHAPFLSRPDETLACWREFLA